MEELEPILDIVNLRYSTLFLQETATQHMRNELYRFVILSYDKLIFQIMIILNQ